MKTNQQTYWGNSYRGFEIYSGSKAVHGFNPSILERSYQLVTTALQTMQKPVGFHIVIEQPTEQLKYLDQWLTRWAEQQNISTKPLFILVNEIRRKTKHTHIHVIADCAGYPTDQIKELLMVLVNQLRRKNVGTNLKLYKRDASRLPRHIKPDGTEVITASIYFHELRKELADYIHRLSYLAKVFTKDHTRRNWRSSNIKNRQIYEEKRNNAEKIKNIFINKIKQLTETNKQYIHLI